VSRDSICVFIVRRNVGYVLYSVCVSCARTDRRRGERARKNGLYARTPRRHALYNVVVRARRISLPLYRAIYGPFSKLYSHFPSTETYQLLIFGTRNERFNVPFSRLRTFEDARVKRHVFNVCYRTSPFRRVCWTFKALGFRKTHVLMSSREDLCSSRSSFKNQKSAYTHKETNRLYGLMKKQKESPCSRTVHAVMRITKSHVILVHANRQIYICVCVCVYLAAAECIFSANGFRRIC